MFAKHSSILSRNWIVPVVVLLLALTISLCGCGGGGGGNVSNPQQQVVAAPSVAPAGGTFKYAQTVTMTDITPGATIYYTLDGSTPTAASTKYTAPVSVSTTLNLNAIAVSGGVSSGVVNQFFTINTITGIISTVAGDGHTAYNGDGIKAIAAGMVPIGAAADAKGNFYIVDAENERIRMVDTSGAITTVAGNGNASFSGDGGPATDAELNEPSGVAVDAGGDLYIADFSNNRIRKVTPDGVISTVAGDGQFSYDGDGGQAIDAGIGTPSAVAVDGSGNLYIADFNNSNIRKVTPAGVITTVAGGNMAGYSGDGGPATSAQINGPVGVAIDNAGNLYISDLGNVCIRMVNTAGIISTISQPYDGIEHPIGIAVDNLGGLLYIADNYLNRVLVRTPDGVYSTVAGDGEAEDGSDSEKAELSGPTGVAVDSVGNLYITESQSYHVRKVTF